MGRAASKEKEQFESVWSHEKTKMCDNICQVSVGTASHLEMGREIALH